MDYAQSHLLGGRHDLSPTILFGICFDWGMVPFECERIFTILLEIHLIGSSTPKNMVLGTASPSLTYVLFSNPNVLPIGNLQNNNFIQTTVLNSEIIAIPIFITEV